ncbi:hypothetical protein B0T13DRAFT_447201 [Neurospora crassa]|nr:hypothetical protein B0T13DRAFT_447201 [Neurospora crassa]
MKSHLLSVFSLLGLSTVASALAVLPPTARHEQVSLQPIHNVHDTHGANIVSDIMTMVVTTLQATKNFPSTLNNFFVATHPERHSHFFRKVKRDLNHQDDSQLGLFEAFNKAFQRLVDIEDSISGFVEGLGKSKTAPVDSET